ncbi:ATP-binding protein [Nonomuraea sp. NPDC049695]|uniref:ATP-binding protein n=1 Tax=Nonomuraea sp. NPDC049695 TaxID=3154734 RepID=UPI003413DB4B
MKTAHSALNEIDKATMLQAMRAAVAAGWRGEPYPLVFIEDFLKEHGLLPAPEASPAELLAEAVLPPKGGASLRAEWVLAPQSADVEVPVDERRVRVLRGHACSHARRVGLPESFLAELRLAVSELATNAAETHARGKVEMLLQIDPGTRVSVHIVDQGDPENKPRPQTAADDAESGRGLSICAQEFNLTVSLASECPAGHSMPDGVWCCSVWLPWPNQRNGQPHA